MIAALLLFNILAWTYIRLLEKKTVFPHALLLQSILAFFISLSLISMLFVLSVFSKSDYLFFLSFITAASVAGLFFSRHQRLSLPLFHKSAILPMIAVLIISLFFIRSAYKWGGFDSFAIWCLHAKFLLYPEWKNYLVHDMAWSHPDYPLMLSSWIAMFWKSTGIISGIIPSIIAYLVLISIPLVSWSAFRAQGMRLSALLVLFLFAFDLRFTEIASALASDTLLSLFFLIVFILYERNKEQDKHGLLLGFFAACCAWIKNEGLLFLLIFSLYYLIVRFRKPQELLKFAAGALVPLVLVLFFKMRYAPPTDLFAERAGMGGIDQLLEPGRYAEIFLYFLSELWMHYKVLLLLLLAALVFRRSYFRSFSFLVIFTLLGGYFMVYLISPNDLSWHLETSCERLLHQVYPAMVFSITWYLGKEEEA